jgi:Uma2 family endonuclease
MAQLSIPIPLPPPTRRVRLSFEVEARTDLFLLDEDDMPESPLHDQIIDLLKFILAAWAARAGRDVLVARNLACRHDPSDARVGVDPDLCVVEPAPSDLDTLKQLRLWDGHAAPWLGIEVVSGSTADKDYHDAPVRYAVLGTHELWVFDPLREGPSDTGGPFVLQVWERRGARMERIYAGNGPAQSPGLDAWLVVTDGGRKLRVADDAGGQKLWPTEAEAKEQQRAQEQKRAQQEQARAQQERERAEQAEQAERAAREQAEAARQRSEAERAAREQAEAEVAELRRQLAALKAAGQREP